MDSEQRRVRLDKLARIREIGINAYPDRYPVTHSCAAAVELEEGTSGVRCAGRLLARRLMGKLSFGHIQDVSGRLQISLERDVVSAGDEKLFKKLVDIGDHIGVEGTIWRTRRGELTLGARRIDFLGKALRPLPEKWHGLKDAELRYRQRYLDLVMTPQTREVFRLRSRVISFIRKFLDEKGFLEVETPILQGAACGASARPFVTHHNALDIELFLRISPETYLKRLIAGGLDRVYEIGRNFRNEGLDASHLQEFTMLEYYAAYWNWRDNMAFVKEMIQALVAEITGGTRIHYGDRTLDFGGGWQEIEFRDLLLEDTGIDIFEVHSEADLIEEIAARKIDLETGDRPSYAALLDALYKKISRPHLVQPTLLTQHPAALVPLARRNDAAPERLDMFQILVNSWEIVKAYSELVDPIEQRARLEDQARLRAAGDEETMMLEPDYIECMEHGMPPISGLGLGIDRLVCLLADQRSLRDVVFFPVMRAAPGSAQARGGNVEASRSEGASGQT